MNLHPDQGEDGGAESGDDDEEDDGFFVPHGYLSDSEGDHSGDEGTKGQDNHVRERERERETERERALEHSILLNLGAGHKYSSQK